MKLKTSFHLLFLTSALLIMSSGVKAQTLSEKYKSQLTLPKSYVCYLTSVPIKIDGVLDEDSWVDVPFTESFVDISGEGFPKPRFDTKAKMLWDDYYLYVAAVLEEPNLWAYLQNHDDIVYNDPDFEVFINPTGDAHNYFEIEVNAIGTVFDLSLENAYRAKQRPFIQFQYNTPGLKTGIQRMGTLNNANDTDRGWIVEMAIPREAIAAEFDNYLKAGSYLRIDFSRVEWQTDVDANGKYIKKKDAKGKNLPEDNWVWSPTGLIAMHMPERWGYLYLSAKTAGKGTEQFVYPEDVPVRRFLWRMFYAQEAQYNKSKTYLNRLKDFHLTKDEMAELPKGSTVEVEATSHTYEITVTAADGKNLVIDESGRCFYRK